MSNGVTREEFASKWFSRILTFLILVTVALGVVWIGFGLDLAHPSASQSSTLDSVQKAFWACLSAFIGMVGGKITP